MTDAERTSDLTNGQAPGKRIDWRTLAVMVIAALIGVAWAAYNFTSTDGRRGDDQLQALVWTIFATPFALFLGWVLVRRAEVWLAAFACFCLYFFTPFVAARIQSFMMTPEEAAATGRSAYFIWAMVLHVVGALALAVWRARAPYRGDQPATDEAPSADQPPPPEAGRAPDTA